MDAEIHSQDQNIRKIEDVIDIQKAKGSYNTRQVAFALPSDSGSTVSATVVKSLETGLSNSKSKSSSNKKLRKLQVKRYKGKGEVPDVISWPSDSDVTVLRMKLLNGSDLKENVANNVTGDGLHQPDSSSMVNLATLMLQSQTPSKHSVLEEYLLPLSSWEEEKNAEEKFFYTKENQIDEVKVFRSVTQEALSFLRHKHNIPSEGLSSRDSGFMSNRPKKCKIARFLRLYFCPCCSCLYEIERMRTTRSSEI